jgi:hypothetical protein
MVNIITRCLHEIYAFLTDLERADTWIRSRPDVVKTPYGYLIRIVVDYGVNVSDDDFRKQWYFVSDKDFSITYIGSQIFDISIYLFYHTGRRDWALRHRDSPKSIESIKPLIRHQFTKSQYPDMALMI